MSKKIALKKWLCKAVNFRLTEIAQAGKIVLKDGKPLILGFTYRRCRYCGHLVEPKTFTCPYCGASI